MQVIKSYYIISTHFKTWNYDLAIKDFRKAIEIYAKYELAIKALDVDTKSKAQVKN